MTVATSTSFDMATFKRSYEEWDIEALLALYAGEVEVIQIDRDNPPSAPRTRHGKDVLRGMFEHCAGAGVAADRGGHRCRRAPRRRDGHMRVPGGRRVLATAILELEDRQVGSEVTLRCAPDAPLPRRERRGADSAILRTIAGARSGSAASASGRLPRLVQSGYVVDALARTGEGLKPLTIR